MFRITYTPSAHNVFVNELWQIQGIIDAARENGAIIEEWDARSKKWREI